MGDVALGSSQVPEQFVICIKLRVFLLGEDRLMFLPGDGAFGIEFNLWPLPFRNDRFGNPIHVEGKIVNTPEKYIGRNRSLVKCIKKMFSLHFNQGKIAEQVKRPVLDGGVSPLSGIA